MSRSPLFSCQNGDARRKALRQMQRSLWLRISLRALHFLYTCFITACMVLLMLVMLLVALDAPLDPPASTQITYRESI